MENIIKEMNINTFWPEDAVDSFIEDMEGQHSILLNVTTIQELLELGQGWIRQLLIDMVVALGNKLVDLKQIFFVRRDSAKRQEDLFFRPTAVPHELTNWWEETIADWRNDVQHLRQMLDEGENHFIAEVVPIRAQAWIDEIKSTMLEFNAIHKRISRMK